MDGGTGGRDGERERGREREGGREGGREGEGPVSICIVVHMRPAAHELMRYHDAPKKKSCAGVGKRGSRPHMASGHAPTFSSTFLFLFFFVNCVPLHST
jgi:hypothetical protein